VLRLSPAKASCTNFVQKNQFPELNWRILIFRNKFYCLESHTEHRWSSYCYYYYYFIWYHIRLVLVLGPRLTYPCNPVLIPGSCWVSALDWTIRLYTILLGFRVYEVRVLRFALFLFLCPSIRSFFCRDSSSQFAE
jgi:hypothetical protein